jgi:hypothetical protein
MKVLLVRCGNAVALHISGAARLTLLEIRGGVGQ